MAAEIASRTTTFFLMQGLRVKVVSLSVVAIQNISLYSMAAEQLQLLKKRFTSVLPYSSYIMKFLTEFYSARQPIRPKLLIFFAIYAIPYLVATMHPCFWSQDGLSRTFRHHYSTKTSCDYSGAA